MAKRTTQERLIADINEKCSEISWEADTITDILIGRDYIEIPPDFIDRLRKLTAEIEYLRTGLK
jgi:hypothetical protein